MGECFISRRGGESYKLPILNENYPQDVSVTASINISAGFSVAISEHGKPAEYTYQWYVNGSAVSGATGATYQVSVALAGTYTVYCEVTNKAGTTTSRIATLIVLSTLPDYSYSGTHEIVYEDDNKVNWKMRCLSGGNLSFARDISVDVFIVGGGGAGGGGNYDASGGAGGGAGGYTTTQKGISVTAGESYSVIVGAGGVSDYSNNGTSGGSSSAFGYSASGGGYGRTQGTDINGGSGGAAGGNGGAPGADGGDGAYEFGDTTAARYGGGGGGGGDEWYWGGAGGAGGGGEGGDSYRCETANRYHGKDGEVNTGGGGGGAGAQAGGNSNGEGIELYGGDGGSGIVIVRNAR